MIINNQHQHNIKALKQYAKMETQEDIANFESLVWLLTEEKNETILSELFTIFDDDCPHLEVMWTLQHAIEDYDNEVYIKRLILNLDKFTNASEWLLTSFYRIMNNTKCLKILEDNLHFADHKILDEIFNKIYEESEDYRAIIEKLRTKFINNMTTRL